MSHAKPRDSRLFRQVRAGILALGVIAGAVCLWPRPDDQHLAAANGQVLHHMLHRYAEEHNGAPCGDLTTLLSSAETGGYNVRVRNPYNGVISSFEDPAIARPLPTRRGTANEAGVVFYQTMPDALGRVEWVIQVGTPTGKLQSIRQADPMIVRLAVR